tara:strand:+ start:485 stop:910 length:426 start_codon:yes stop_codon:yes gene_type:complete
MPVRLAVAVRAANNGTNTTAVATMEAVMARLQQVLQAQPRVNTAMTMDRLDVGSRIGLTIDETSGEAAKRGSGAPVQTTGIMTGMTVEQMSIGLERPVPVAQMRVAEIQLGDDFETIEAGLERDRTSSPTRRREKLLAASH